MVGGALSQPCEGGLLRASSLCTTPGALLAARPFFLPAAVAAALSAMATASIALFLPESLPALRAQPARGGSRVLYKKLSLVMLPDDAARDLGSAAQAQAEEGAALELTAAGGRKLASDAVLGGGGGDAAELLAAAWGAGDLHRRHGQPDHEQREGSAGDVAGPHVGSTREWHKQERQWMPPSHPPPPPPQSPYQAAAAVAEVDDSAHPQQQQQQQQALWYRLPTVLLTLSGCELAGLKKCLAPARWRRGCWRLIAGGQRQHAHSLHALSIFPSIPLADGLVAFLFSFVEELLPIFASGEEARRRSCALGG